jgi:hypothetical protein
MLYSLNTRRKPADAANRPAVEIIFAAAIAARLRAILVRTSCRHGAAARGRAAGRAGPKSLSGRDLEWSFSRTFPRFVLVGITFACYANRLHGLTCRGSAAGAVRNDSHVRHAFGFRGLY